ncbi:E3 ubiquitin- ligase CHFR isoform X3, partial [Brachionus plicatilis]
MEKYWGIIKRVDGNAASTPIKLFKDTYHFGRTKDCEFCYENKFLSKKHCIIQRNEHDKTQFFLCDQSSNGTLVNLNQKIKQEKIKLNDKDVIYLVHRANQPEKNIILKFEIISESKPGEKIDSIECERTNINEKRSIDSDDNLKDKIQKIEVENESVEKKEFQTNQDEDDFMENISCSICNDIIYDCVSLQPCMHSYCGACYSDWMVKSQECPICRKKVERIAKNYLINNIIESFLKKHPHKKRSSSEINLLNEKNKILQDMPYPERNDKVEKYQDDYESGDDLKKNQNEQNNDQNNSDTESDRGSIFRSDNESDGEHSDHDDNIFANNYRNNLPVANIWPNPNQYFHPPVYNQPFRFTCRQCPQNKFFNYAPLAPDYTCNQFQNHLLCQCCLEAMPDRNQEMNRNPLLPKQNCTMCFTPYCNLYWGCNKGGCKKCLVHFKDFVPDNDCLNLLINENQYESQLFSDWVVRKNKKIEDIFQDCLAKLKLGKYRLQAVNINDALDKIVCRKCAAKLFSELAYQFRSEISNEQIFNNDDQRRPDCYWGKECRTQKHNLNHS